MLKRSVGHLKHNSAPLDDKTVRFILANLAKTHAAMAPKAAGIAAANVPAFHRTFQHST